MKKNKNLLYYTIFDDEGNDYVNLLCNSIKSLGNQRKFDILVLTDINTQHKIDKVLPDYNIQYKIFNKVKDGVDASKIKVRIFEYDNIDNYDTILFLDADTIIINDLNSIFKQKWKKDTLYTAYNKNVTMGSHRSSLYHGIQLMCDETFDKVKKNKQHPFNAGQFLFRNTKKMKKHFENVVWFMENWPGEYFFEQSFMNHYFCVNNLTECTKFDKYVKLIPSDSFELPTEDQIILHFIGPALDGKHKNIHIDNYFRVNDLTICS